MGDGMLLVDIGNSRVKWGRAAKGRIEPGCSFSSSSEALGGHLNAAWRTLSKPRAVYAANVAGPEMGEALEAWVSGYWGCPVRFAASEAAACGVANGYEQPETLGVDRWMGLIGLRRHYGLPVCLADCGTALTFDVVDAVGRHLGGLIVPGPALMRRALSRETHGVRTAEGRGIPDFTGRSTALAVESGVFRACAGLIEKSMAEASALLGHEPALIVTGGDGKAIGSLLGIPYRLDPDLVLRGLLALADSET